MKLVILVVATLVFSGCVYQDIDSNEVNKSIELCNQRGGLHSIRESFDGSTTTMCNDYSRIRVITGELI